MTVAISPVHRSFTVDQSSAINSITVEGTDVIITYQSNPEKAYAFTATETYAQFLSDLMTNDEILKNVSIGSTIADARKTEELKAVWYDFGGCDSPLFTSSLHIVTFELLFVLLFFTVLQSLKRKLL